MDSSVQLVQRVADLPLKRVLKVLHKSLFLPAAKRVVKVLYKSIFRPFSLHAGSKIEYFSTFKLCLVKTAYLKDK
jgi:hypothetical protein